MRERLTSLKPRRLVGLAKLALAVLALASCQQQTPTPPSNALVVIVRPAPGAWFIGEADLQQGFEHDLIAAFAAAKGMELRAVTADSATDLVRQVSRGGARVGLGGLLRPDLPARAPRTAMRPPSDPERDVLWTRGITSVEPVLIYNADGFHPRSFGDLAGAEVAYLPDTGVAPWFVRLRSEHPEVHWKALELASADALIAEVDDARVNYAIVTSADVALARNVHVAFDVAFPVAPKREIAWIVPAGESKLRDELDAWIAKVRADGTLDRLLDRYFAPARNLARIDAGALGDRIDTLLPPLRKYFEAAQDQSGIDWRLLAAVAYQESQWDPLAVSETGARGIMQLTSDTAKHLGVEDRLDPRPAIIAAARYLRDLRNKLPARITEPDRTFMMLAAFNIGLGHLEDARVLAQKRGGNPDKWDDVRLALPLLAEPEYFAGAKLGYARGGMPVAFVQRVRSYYDILTRSLPPHSPRLNALSYAPAIP